MKRAYKLGVEGPPVKGWRPEGSGPRVTPGAVTAGAGRRHGPRPRARSRPAAPGAVEPRGPAPFRHIVSRTTVRTGAQARPWRGKGSEAACERTPGPRS